MPHDELILNRYEPIGTAGTGGFGTVRIAWDPRIQRKVAIKTIKLTALDAARAALPGAQAVADEETPDDAPNGQAFEVGLPYEDPLPSVGGFTDEGELPDEDAPPDDAGSDWQPITSLAHIPGLDEARTAAMLSDPRIVTVFDFEVRGRFAYLIMEYVEGITLSRLLSEYGDYLTLDMVAAVFDSVAGALESAHGAGVLHLDIKPDNILINPQGKVKVTDFGLATLADASGAGTTGGGTIGYMPLEQMRREHLDVRTDEWSLASVAYEMLVGTNPFKAPTLEAAESAILNAELVVPSLCWDNLDDQVDDVVFYALDPDREERYDTVRDFAEELDKFLGDADEGAGQLADVVADALGLYEEEELAEGPDGYGEYDDQGAWADASLPERRHPGVVRGFLNLFDLGSHDAAVREGAPGGDAEYGYENDEVDFEPSARGVGGSRDSRAGGGEKASHVPIAQRLPEKAVAIGSRACGALASGFVTFAALSNIPPLPPAFGPGAAYVIAFGVIVVGVLGALWPSVGALVSLCIFGVALATCGHPVVAAITLIATVAWWYVFGHEGKAAANCALLVPTLGAIGGSTAVPFLAGSSLKPLQAIATTVYAVILAGVFACLGSGTLLGWDAFAHWDFTQADIGGNALALVTKPATWTTAAGWIAAAAVLSLTQSRGGRFLSVVGIAVALVAVLAGSLVFAEPSPQLIVTAALVAAGLLFAFC